jgi:hypothetical protein
MKAISRNRVIREGPAESLWKTKRTFPLRIWIVDNSGSMATTDGHRVVETPKKNDVKFVNCTRWSEMQQTVDDAQLAALIKSPTVFACSTIPDASSASTISIAERGDALLTKTLLSRP